MQGDIEIYRLRDTHEYTGDFRPIVEWYKEELYGPPEEELDFLEREYEEVSFEELSQYFCVTNKGGTRLFRANGAHPTEMWSYVSVLEL